MKNEHILTVNKEGFLVFFLRRTAGFLFFLICLLIIHTSIQKVTIP